MAFKQANFAPVGNQAKPAVAPQMWSYKTADAVTDVRKANYFNDVRMLLQIGDLINVCVVTNLGLSNETLSTSSWVVVKDKSATAVDVTDQTAITVTDTD